MVLTIFLQKEVTTMAEAQSLLDATQSRLSDYPDIKITGSVNNTLVLAELSG